MSESVAGWIVYKNVPYHKGLHRFIKKQITKWVKTNGSDPALLEDARYRVVFNREGEQKSVECRLELRMRLQVWVALEAAPNPDTALIRSLQHMKFVDNPLHLPAWAQRSMGLSRAG